MELCPQCTGSVQSWVHCPMDGLVCSKCCGSCDNLDSRTSIIRCTYRNEKTEEKRA